MSITPQKGMILVVLDPDKDEIDGILLDEKERQVWGAVESYGAPLPKMYSIWEQMVWILFGRHPIGARVLVSEHKGVYWRDGDKKYWLGWQTDILAWNNQDGNL